MKIITSYPPKTCEFCHTEQPESAMVWQETVKDSIARRTRYVWGCRDINACLDRKAHLHSEAQEDLEPAETFEQAKADALYEAAEERSHEQEAFDVLSPGMVKNGSLDR